MPRIWHIYTEEAKTDLAGDSFPFCGSIGDCPKMAKKSVSRVTKKNIAAHLGASPKQIASDLRMFSRAARVLSSNHPRLIDAHPKEWVGIYDNRVCASAKSLPALMAALRKDGIPPSKTIVRYIDVSGRKMIL